MRSPDGDTDLFEIVESAAWRHFDAPSIFSRGILRGRSPTGQILTVHRIFEGVKAENLNTVLLCVFFSDAFVCFDRGKRK